MHCSKNGVDIFLKPANISAFLNEILPNINWVGFYLLEDKELVLGPFQGKGTCLCAAAPL